MNKTQPTRDAKYDTLRALQLFKARITNIDNLKNIRTVVDGLKITGSESEIQSANKIKSDLLAKLDEISKIPESQEKSDIGDGEAREVAALLIKFRGVLSTKADDITHTSQRDRFNTYTLKHYLFAPKDKPLILEDTLCPTDKYEGCSPRSDLGEVYTGVNGRKQVILGGRKHKTKKHKKKGKKKTMKKKGKKKTMKKKGKKKSMKKKGKKSRK